MSIFDMKNLETCFDNAIDQLTTNKSNKKPYNIAKNLLHSSTSTDPNKIKGFPTSNQFEDDHCNIQANVSDLKHLKVKALSEFNGQ